MPADAYPDISNPDDRYHIKSRIRKRLENFLNILTYTARTYPRGTAYTSMFATAAIQSNTFSTFIGGLKQFIPALNDEQAPTQLHYIMGFLAITIVCNLKQVDKLASYSEMLGDALNGTLTPRMSIPNVGYERVKRIANTITSVSANAISIANLTRKIDEERLDVMITSLVLGLVAAFFQLPTTLEFYGVVEFTEYWSNIFAFMFSGPDAGLYFSANTPGNSLLAFTIVAPFALLAIPVIKRQYHGNRHADQAFQDQTSLDRLSQLAHLGEAAPLLGTNAAEAELLTKIGLNNEIGWATSQLLLVVFKAMGMIFSLKTIANLMIGRDSSPLEVTGWLDILLFIIISLFILIFFIPNAVARNLMAETGLKLKPGAVLNIQK